METVLCGASRVTPCVWNRCGVVLSGATASLHYEECPLQAPQGHGRGGLGACMHAEAAAHVGNAFQGDNISAQDGPCVDRFVFFNGILWQSPRHSFYMWQSPSICHHTDHDGLLIVHRLCWAALCYAGQHCVMIVDRLCWAALCYAGQHCVMIVHSGCKVRIHWLQQDYAPEGRCRT